MLMSKAGGVERCYLRHARDGDVFPYLYLLIDRPDHSFVFVDPLSICSEIT